MNFDIIFKRNGKEYNGTSWSLGDTIEINLNLLSTAARSRIDIMDNRSNVRYFSIHGGRINTLIAKISEDHRFYGDWCAIISIRDKDNTYTENYPLKIELEKIISDNSSNDEFISENTANTAEKQEITISDMVEEDSNADQVIVKSKRKDISNPLENISFKTTHQSDDKHEKIYTDIEPIIEVALPNIIINGLTENEAIHTLDAMRSESDLDRILGIGISKLQMDEFNIPVAEISCLDHRYRSILEENGIQYIGHMLRMKPVDIMSITLAPLEKIKSWYRFLYKVYINEEHILRKEYRHT